MSIQPRPSDSVTEDYLILGVPVIEWAFETSPGVFGAFFGLGIPSSSEVQKELQTAKLLNSQSGAAKLVRELVRSFESTLAITTFRHSGANMQLMFASNVLEDVAAASTVIAGEIIRLQADHLTFLNTAKQLIETSPTPTVAPGTITLEAVGTGQGGTFGETQGDFVLDFKPLVVADVASLLVGGTERVGDIVAGAAPTAGQIGIIEGVGATSGEMIFPSGEGPALGAAVVATYTPSHGPLVENTDFFVDYNEGRIRVLGPFGGATDPFRSTQPMSLGYTYSQPVSQRIKPFTQFTFAGKARIRQLTEVGMNLIWTVPKAQVRLTPDAFVFNRDDLTVTALAIQLLEDTDFPAEPFGTMEIYREGTF
jgi:hypothetical protein